MTLISSAPSAVESASATLFDRVALGDVAAFSELFDLYEVRAWQLSRRFSDGADDADSTFLAAWTEIWRNAPLIAALRASASASINSAVLRKAWARESRS